MKRTKYSTVVSMLRLKRIHKYAQQKFKLRNEDEDEDDDDDTKRYLKFKFIQLFQIKLSAYATRPEVSMGRSRELLHALNTNRI